MYWRERNSRCKDLLLPLRTIRTKLWYSWEFFNKEKSEWSLWEFNGLPDNCFAYNNLKRGIVQLCKLELRVQSLISSGEFNKHGMFNEECYMSKQLNSNDTVYYRHLKVSTFLDQISNLPIVLRVKMKSRWFSTSIQHHGLDWDGDPMD